MSRPGWTAHRSRWLARRPGGRIAWAIRPLLACLTVAVALLVAALAGATVPIGEQFRISNVGTDGDADTGVQGRVAAAFDPDAGRYLVVYMADPGGVDLEIYGRFVAADGAIAGDAFQISESGVDDEPLYGSSEPAVAYNPVRKEFLVAWDGTEDYAAVRQQEIFVQRLDASGQPVGTDDQRISTMGPDDVTGYGVSRPGIAFNPIADEYLVVWDGEDNRGGMVLGENEVFAQRLDGDGAEIGTDDMRVSTIGPDGDTSHYGQDVSVAFEPGTQRYMIAFAGNETANTNEILVQRLAADGTEIGTDDQRISAMGGNDADPFFPGNTNVAANPVDHEFLVAWESDDDTGALVAGEYEVYVQRVTADGAEVGPDDRRLSTAGEDGDSDVQAGDRPALAFSALDREWLVAWEAEDGAEQEYEVYVQRLSAEGEPVGTPELRLSHMGPDGDGTYEAHSPGAAHDPTRNDYLVVWRGDTDAGDLVDGEEEVWGRRFDGVATPQPAGTPTVGPTVTPTPDSTPPALSGLALAPTRFRAFTSGPSIRTAARRGAQVYYTLGEAATTGFAVRRARRGRRVRGRCVAPRRKHRDRRRCVRYVRVPGGFAHPGSAGANTFAFSGRIAGKRLKPGRYRLVGVASDAAGNASKPARAAFRITRR